MKKIQVNIFNKATFVLLTLGLFLLGSCKDYLSQAPEVTISEDDIYKEFRSFQGFTEELYAVITDPSKHQLGCNMNLADEGVMSVTFFASTAFDAGNYWSWYQLGYTPFGRDLKLVTSPTSHEKGLWPCGWYGIRKANLGLANLDKLVNATQEEKDFIKGQLLFFRGYYNFQIIKDWGGMPYIDRVLTPTEELKLERLKYRESALKATADLEEAAKLLPENWDNTATGKRTLGNNRQRINKIMALSFAGKCLLYAASPLMNRESTGNATFDADLCKKAADKFADVINLCNASGMYKLQPWATYSDMFFNVGLSPSPQPGGVEVIFNAPTYDATIGVNRSLYLLNKVGGTGNHFSPSANYVKNWGMANGLPLEDATSGYNPADPWANRDARFYKTIMIDGDRICNSATAGIDTTVQLFRTGRHRTPASTNESFTGYDIKKYMNPLCNRFDNIWANGRYQFMPPLMRLSDVYLMYAEAVLQGYGTAQSKSPTGTLTAEAAVNAVRARATVPPVAAKYTASKDAFMGEIIRERAVELSFEGLRWNDLRRWLLCGDAKYLDKTDLVFDRGTNGKPINIQEKLILTRVFTDKNNWLPIPLDFVTLYPGFKQNPGY